MSHLRFYIVDVFAEHRLTGNQLAVFRNIRSLLTKEMQQIAREINYSETTFILSEKRRKDGYDVRIFTPVKEVPFAGHPTLGTAYIIQREILGRPTDEVKLNLKVGQIPVKFRYMRGKAGVLWMKQLQPEFGANLSASDASETLSLSHEDIDKRFPIQEVSTGLPFVIVPLKTLDAVKRAKIDSDKLSKLLRTTKSDALLVFSPETYKKENDLNVRVFIENYGQPEDPATGSANGCLAAYLVRYRYFGTDHIDLKVEQGYEIGRPSLLFIKAEQLARKIDVFVGGAVHLIAKGEFV